MHECIHICIDIDSAQNIKKGIQSFLSFKNEDFCHFFSFQKKL